jgi:hypothetical protein
LYAEYSPRAQSTYLFDKIYTHTYKTSFGTYSFVIHDQTTEPGFESPFNSFSIPVFDTQMKDLETHLQNAKENSNLTMIVGHFPTCQMQSNNEFLAAVRDRAAVYLTGHYHSRDMYTRMKIGDLLELEVADFKDKSMFRVVAIDNDVFSFGMYFMIIFYSLKLM